MAVLPTGSADLDAFGAGYPSNALSLVYGEGGSGKTTLCLLASIHQAVQGKKVLFLDAENNFSSERFEQLLNGRDKKCLQNILVLKVKNFTVQHNQIKNLESVKNVALIVVDSINHYYRRLYSREPEIAKGMLGKQLRVLAGIAEQQNIPVLITSQVYSNLENETLPLAKNILGRFVEYVIRLEKDPRRMMVERPEKKQAAFQIVREGIEIVKE